MSWTADMVHLSASPFITSILYVKSAEVGYLSKHGGVFAGVAEGVNVPGDPRATTRPKGLVEEPQAHGHLVDDGAVVGGGLVTHAPAAVHKLQATCRDGETSVRVTFTGPGRVNVQ